MVTMSLKAPLKRLRLLGWCIRPLAWISRKGAVRFINWALRHMNIKYRVGKTRWTSLRLSEVLDAATVMEGD